MFWFEFSTRRKQAESESHACCTASMFHVLLSSYVAHSHNVEFGRLLALAGTVRMYLQLESRESGREFVVELHSGFLLATSCCWRQTVQLKWYCRLLKAAEGSIVSVGHADFAPIERRRFLPCNRPSLIT